MTPPPYPRIPYLYPPPGDADNVLAPERRSVWLERPLLVEEKLDGANVTLWMDGTSIRVASRGGADAMDRAGQLGRLRAWAADHDLALRAALSGGTVIYGEWLWITHSVHYDRLPDWLVVLDLRHPDSSWAGPPERDEIARRAGLTTPPTVFQGVLGDQARLLGLIGQSAFASGPAEGLVLRAPDGTRCKLVRPDFERVRDEAFTSARRHNRLA